MISQSLMTKIRDDLDRWETPVLWMYLDSEGYGTVGCGTMLPDGDSARNGSGPPPFRNVEEKNCARISSRSALTAAHWS